MIKPIKIKELLDFFNDDEERHVDQEIVIEALKEAFARAYIRQLDAPDAIVRVEIDDKYLSMYHDLLVVEKDSGYDELEISLDKAKTINEDIKVGEYIAQEVDIRTLNRSAVIHVKTILKQKIREAEKLATYNEFIDSKGELMIGNITSVEANAVHIKIGKGYAVMPKSQQIPGELYYPGTNIRVLVTDVKKETKGAQILVSRADATFVKRLFEREVPEIFQGSVEIKAIARDAGERTKMAVYSKDDNIDPIGACIGPRGSRIQAIIEEIKGEKIDVFQWSDDVSELIKNAFSPASILGCYYNDNQRDIIVVVDDSQLSLAIGRKGKNVKLAIKLLGCKIEIKTQSEIEEEGIDLSSKTEEFNIKQSEILKAKEEEKFKQAQEEMIRKREALEKIEEENPFNAFENGYEESAAETDDTNQEVEPEVLEKVEGIVEEKEEPVVEKKEETKQEEQTSKEEENSTKVKIDFEEKRKKATYVSKFEELADISTKHTESTKKKRRKKKDDDRKLRPNELNRNRDWEFKVEYSEEELEEIEAMQAEEQANSWIEDDIDFDEYDEYYDGEIK